MLYQYTETMIVRNADSDFRGGMKPGALLRCVEQISADHIRLFGMDDQFFKDRQAALLVGRQALRFLRVPRRAEELTLTTIAERAKRGTLKRITVLSDAAGQEVARVDSRWITVDTAKGCIVREPNWMKEGICNDDIPDELPRQVHRAKDLTFAGTWKAHYSLCDINGHLNNACYLDIACDALPPKVLEQGPVVFASVKYNREVPKGESMEVFYAPSGDGWYLVGRREGHNAFECYLELGCGKN